MASLIDLRRRIRSVKNTQQITKAMKMVAAAKLRRSQDKIVAARPYAEQLQKVTEHLASQSSGGSGEAAHPMLESRPEKRVLLAVVTGDKGLCGSFNSNVIRRAEQVIAERNAEQGVEIELLALGKRDAEYFSRRPTKVRAEHRNLFANVRKADADAIASDLSEAYVEGEYDAVYVVYNQFVSALRQDLMFERVLPVNPQDIESDDDAGHDEASADYIYEPSAEDILAELLPRFVSLQVYRVLLDSQAAEHAARMTAMDSATKNAKDLIERLTLIYNRSRQAAITTELIEVVSGAAALEG